MALPLVDIVDRNNQPRGFTADVGQAKQRGLWFRAIHVLVYTPGGLVLVERRSHSMMFYPDQLDISLGGIVDSGEDPLNTAVRELKEEMGLPAKPDQLERVSVTRYNHHFTQQHIKARTINYHYLLEIPSPHIAFHLQRSEVAEARFITLAETRQLVHKHRLAGFGKLIGRYAMYDHLLDIVEERLEMPA